MSEHEVTLARFEERLKAALTDVQALKLSITAAFDKQAQAITELTKLVSDANKGIAEHKLTFAEYRVEQEARRARIAKSLELEAKDTLREELSRKAIAAGSATGPVGILIYLIHQLLKGEV